MAHCFFYTGASPGGLLSSAKDELKFTIWLQPGYNLITIWLLPGFNLVTFINFDLPCLGHNVRDKFMN